MGDFDAMEEEEEEERNRMSGRRKPDPPLSSVDVTSGGDALFGSNNIGESPSIDQRRRSSFFRRDSQSSTMMTPHLDVDAEDIDGSFKNDFLPASGFSGIDDNPFDELFNFGDGNSNNSLFGSPIFGCNNLVNSGSSENNNTNIGGHNNNNSIGAVNINNNNNVNSFEPFAGQQKLVLSPPVVVHPPKILPLPPPLTRRDPIVGKQPPANLLSSPLKRPLPPSATSAPTKGFSAMLSSQYAVKEPPASKSCMNCIICDDVIEGQTKIEQWIKLCQHLANKHKKVIDREILTKQFGIQDSAITSSVLEGERGAVASAQPTNIVLKTPHQVNAGDMTSVNASVVTSVPAGTSTSTYAAMSDDKRGDAKARLNRFLCQRRMLNAELMAHVRKVTSVSHEGKDERYSCLRCSKEFDSLTPIQRHLVVNHSVPLPGLQILMCSHCGNKDVDREENMSETGPSKSCNVCKHRMSRMQD